MCPDGWTTCQRQARTRLDMLETRRLEEGVERDFEVRGRVELYRITRRMILDLRHQLVQGGGHMGATG